MRHEQSKDVEGIKSLCDEGAGLECVDKEGRTPLILASKPVVLNDDFQTTLKIARAKGYSNVVRKVESDNCLFSGWMREFEAPSFLGLLSPQLLSRRVWVVILPIGSQNPTKPLKLELLVYDSLQNAKPRMVMALWKANLEEPKSYQSDASVMIVDNSISTRPRSERLNTAFVSKARRWVQVDKQIRLKLGAATQGDMQQLSLFWEACKGISQSMNPPMFLQTTTMDTSIQSERNETPLLNYHAFISKEINPLVPSLKVVAEVEDSSIQYPLVNISRNYENKEDDSSGVCVICVDASSEAVCVPCGHVAGCISCLQKIKDNKLGCPVCCANIDLVIKLYHV